MEPGLAWAKEVDLRLLMGEAADLEKVGAWGRMDEGTRAGACMHAWELGAHGQRHIYGGSCTRGLARMAL